MHEKPCFPSLLWQEVKLFSAGSVMQYCYILVNQCAEKGGCSPGLKRAWGKEWTIVLHQSHHIHLWWNKQHYWETWDVSRSFTFSPAPNNYKFYQTSSNVLYGRIENLWKIHLQSREWALATSPWEICSSTLPFALSYVANLQSLHLAPN